MTVAALEVAAQCGCGPRMASEIDVAASHGGTLAREWGPDGPDDALPKEIARGIVQSVPVVTGPGLTAPIAYRWKTQINENAKAHAFSHQLPELDHNELVAWSRRNGGEPRFAAVFLEDRDQHPRERERAELTARLIGDAATSVIRLETEGETRIARLLWAVMLGDLVSLHLAALAGIDPSPVEVIEQLKEELGRP